jgi:hypothetical protein
MTKNGRDHQQTIPVCFCTCMDGWCSSFVFDCLSPLFGSFRIFGPGRDSVDTTTLGSTTATTNQTNKQ